MTPAARIAAGDRRALSRALSLAEAHDPGARALLAELRPKIGGARRIGFTGPPGAGKSTLIAALVREARKAGKTAAVLAVDPSSPATHGALLGDRIRMIEHTLDEGVFIRSQASRGASGGLAATASDLIDLLDAAGFQRIFIETVGIGQSELEVACEADVTVLVLGPNSGDGIQAMKAGVIEVADLIAVNKADLDGAERTRADLLEGFSLKDHDASERVMLVSAQSGDGVDTLFGRLEAWPDSKIQDRRSAVLAERLDRAVERELGSFRRRAAPSKLLHEVVEGVRSGGIAFDAAVARVVAAALASASDSGGL